MPEPTYNSPTPSNVGGESIGLSPLGLRVSITNNIHPNIQCYTIPALAGYNATTLPLMVMGGIRLFFVQNNQATSVLVVGPSGQGVVVLPGDFVLLGINGAGTAVPVSPVGPEPDPTAPTQAAWFIDATTGVDTNPGTALLPLKTHAELERRLGNQTILQSTDVTIVGALPSSDPINIRYKAAPGIVLRYLQGAPDTVNASTSVVVAAAINRATNTPQSIDTTSSLDAWIGKKIVRTSGLGTWNVAWLAKVVSAGVRYRISPAVALTSIPMTTPTVITPSPLDSIEVRTSPQITLGHIEDVGPVASFTFNRFELEFSSATSIQMPTQIIFQECGQVGAFTVMATNTIAWRASKTLTQTHSRSSGHTYASSLVFGAISQQVYGAVILLSGDTLMQGGVGGGPGLGGISSIDGGRVNISSAGTFDAAAASISCQRWSSYRCVTGHYGSGSVTQLVIENAIGYYSVLPTAVGTTQDMLLGGRARAFNATPAQVPWIDGDFLASGSAFVLGGAAASPISTTKVAAYNAKFGEYVSVDPTGGAFAVTLPTISAAWPDAEVTVTNIGASANVVTVTAAGGQTINGAATDPLAGAFASRTYRSNGGTAWRVVASV